nr:MAG TPA: hypothetical protein [Caudoviricetes sp.]
MRGSEKQIRWANGIKENVLAIIDDAVAACESSNISDAQKASFIGQMNTIKYNVENVDYAGELIDVFASVKHTGDFKADLKAFKSALRIGDINGTFGKGAK